MSADIDRYQIHEFVTRYCAITERDSTMSNPGTEDLHIEAYGTVTPPDDTPPDNGGDDTPDNGEEDES